jgi:hypothetical protein
MFRPFLPAASTNYFDITQSSELFQGILVGYFVFDIEGIGRQNRTKGCKWPSLLQGHDGKWFETVLIDAIKVCLLLPNWSRSIRCLSH